MARQARRGHVEEPAAPAAEPEPAAEPAEAMRITSQQMRSMMGNRALLDQLDTKQSIPRRAAALHIPS